MCSKKSDIFNTVGDEEMTDDETNDEYSSESVDSEYSEDFSEEFDNEPHDNAAQIYASNRSANDSNTTKQLQNNSPHTPKREKVCFTTIIFLHVFVFVFVFAANTFFQFFGRSLVL